MSRMAELAADLEDLMRIHGCTPREAAEVLRRFGCPLSQEELERFGESLAAQEQDQDFMDGDFDSAMASAGFGTDEDYGGDCDRL